MDASVYVGDGVLEVQQVAVPEVGPADVLVEVGQCGICGTDVHLVLEKIARPGTVLGHEWAGTIAALGDDVEGWKIGDRVVCGPSPGCGRCRACRAGRPSVCLDRPLTDHLDFRGAYARYVVAPGAQLLAVPDDLSIREAALVEPTAVALHAVTLSGVTPDDRVLVTGAGPVGMLVTAVLHAQGVHDVTVSEPSPIRREHALKVGAARVVEPHELPRLADGCTGRRALLGGVRVLRSGRRRRVRDRPARLRGHLRAGGYRTRPASHQPQPCDRAGEHDHRFVQLRRRRLRAPRSTCWRRARCRSMRWPSPSTSPSTSCRSRCNVARRVNCPAR